MIVSGFRMSTYSPRLARIATLLPFANLRFRPFSITCTRGNLPRMYSTEPSEEPLSETMTSNSVSCVVAYMDRRQSLMTLRSFQHNMTIDNFIVSVPDSSAESNHYRTHSERSYSGHASQGLRGHRLLRPSQ